MRILLSHYLRDDESPPAQVVHAIAHELRALGHDVRVHRSDGGSKPVSSRVAPETVPRRRFGAGLRGRVWFAKAVARNVPMWRRDLEAVQRFRPEVILTRQDAYCVSMVRAACRLGVPLVTLADAPVAYETRLYHAHERWHPPRLVEALERWGLRRSRAITTPSHPGARKLAEYGLDVPIRVIPNGLSPERFPPLSAQERQAARAAWGITRPWVLGFQGTFKAFHGIDRLRQIMLAMAGREDVHWLLLGDGPERAPLQEAVAGRVSATFRGRQPPEVMGSLLGLIDVAVAPHQFVPGLFYLSPLKILEYAAAGCAIVAGAQGDIPWLLDEGRAGVVLADPEIPVWVAAIERLLEDAPQRQALGAAARRHVLAHFTWRQAAERYEAVLRGVVTGTLPNEPAGTVPEFPGPPIIERADQPACGSLP